MRDTFRLWNLRGKWLGLSATRAKVLANAKVCLSSECWKRLATELARELHSRSMSMGEVKTEKQSVLDVRSLQMDQMAIASQYAKLCQKLIEFYFRKAKFKGTSSHRNDSSCPSSSREGADHLLVWVHSVVQLQNPSARCCGRNAICTNEIHPPAHAIARMAPLAELGLGWNFNETALPEPLGPRIYPIGLALK